MGGGRGERFRSSSWPGARSDAGRWLSGEAVRSPTSCARAMAGEARARAAKAGTNERMVISGMEVRLCPANAKPTRWEPEPERKVRKRRFAVSKAGKPERKQLHRLPGAGKAGGSNQTSANRTRRLWRPLFSTLVMRIGLRLCRIGEMRAAAGLGVESGYVDDPHLAVSSRRRRDRGAADQARRRAASSNGT